MAIRHNSFPTARRQFQLTKIVCVLSAAAVTMRGFIGKKNPLNEGFSIRSAAADTMKKHKGLKASVQPEHY